MNQIMTLSHQDAMKVLHTIKAELEKQGKGAAVAIVDEHGELLAFLRTDGCPLASINISINKAFTAARERRESKAVGTDSKTNGWPMSNFGDIRYTAWGGGVPLVYQGKVVGGVGVSGLPEDEDIVLAKLGAATITE